MTQGQLEELLLAGRQVDDADLSRIDWEDLPSGSPVFRRCTFDDCTFAEADLSGARFENCTFERARFPGTNLTDAVFTGCGFFDGESRSGCDFGRADLDGARFEGCNLSTSRFALANLFDASFKQCKAAGCDFEDAIFGKKTGGRLAVARVHFSGCMLDMASFRQAVLDDCALTECSLRQADLRQVSLRNADLNGSDLSEASFNGAILDSADLRGATLLGLDVTRLASFEGMRVSSDQLSEIVRPLGIRVAPAGR